jgi:hypothetical protein
MISDALSETNLKIKEFDFNKPIKTVLELHRQSYNNLLRKNYNDIDINSIEDDIDDIYSIKGNGTNEEYYEVNDKQYESVFKNDEILEPNPNIFDDDQNNPLDQNDKNLFIEKKRKR